MDKIPAPERVPSPKWLSVAQAATILGFKRVSLRRVLDRNAHRAADGTIESVVDGVVGRKIGRTWRVQLSAAWNAER